MVTGADAFWSGIPEGYLAVGKIDAFKDMLENADHHHRRAREWSRRRQPSGGSTSLNLATLADNLDKIPTDQPVMI
ncbi:MAG: hypothetical protein R2854_19485 [Caldilineaceae bacterium]